MPNARISSMRAFLHTALAATFSAVATAQTPAATTGSGPLGIPIPPAGTLVAITNATILTASHGTIERGTILIRDGKIAAVGTNVQVPPGARVIDGTGRFVTPGIIDAHSHSASEGINEGTESVTAQVRMEDVLRQDGTSLYRQLAGGTTTLNILHGSANTIGGQNAVVKLRYGLPVDSLMFEGAPPGIKFALGENVRQTSRPQPTRYPRTRMGVEDVLRDAFTRAREYQGRWKQYETEKAAFDRARTRGATAPIPPERDLQLDALVEVLEWKRLVHCHSYRAD
jgi:imidazolonepropionase-like amidohydrolase